MVKELVVRLVAGAAAGWEMFTCTWERFVMPVLVVTRIWAKNSTLGFASKEAVEKTGAEFEKARIVLVELAESEMSAVLFAPWETVRLAPVPVWSSEIRRWAARVASVSNMLSLAVFIAIGSMPRMATTAKETIPRATTTSTSENPEEVFISGLEKVPTKKMDRKSRISLGFCLLKFDACPAPPLL